MAKQPSDTDSEQTKEPTKGNEGENKNHKLEYCLTIMRPEWYFLFWQKKIELKMSNATNNDASRAIRSKDL